MQTTINVLKTTRNTVYNFIKDLSLEQIHYIPKNFNNNIAWNITHLVVTQQLLCYKLAQKDYLIPDELIENYKKGTFPTTNFTQEEWEEVLELFLGLPKTLEEDYEEGIFKTYMNYTTSANFEITSIEDAIAFNNYHEGIHLGSILTIKRFLI